MPSGSPPKPRPRPPTWLVRAAAVCLLVGLVLFPIASLSLWHDARDSSRIQNSGIRTEAVVVAVHNHTEKFGPERDGSYSYDYTATITVRTPRGPADIHYPDRSPYRVGEHLTVLLDPRDPTRGEIPGVKATSPAGAVACAVGAVICAALLLWMRRRSRAARVTP